MKRIIIKHADDYAAILYYVKTGCYPKNLNKDKKKVLRKRVKNLMAKDGELFFINNKILKIVLNPKNYKENLEKLTKLHEDGHQGQDKFYKKARNFYENFTREQTNKIVQNCKICKQFKSLQTHNRFISILFNDPWKHCQIDAVDLCAYTSFNDGYVWMINLIDCYLKFRFTFPSKSKSAEDIVRILKGIFYAEGFPKTLQSDNEREFKNSIVVSFWQK